MDLKEESPNLLGQSKEPSSISTSASSGCNLALLIAYNHLKKRFTSQSAELIKLRSVKMNPYVQDGYTTTRILERKVEQLQRSLQSKIIAYNNLEATYKETRENEETLIKHTTETEQLLDDVMLKSLSYQKESEELKEEVVLLTATVNKLKNEMHKLGEELQDIKNVPEVSVSKIIPVTMSFDEMTSPRSSDTDISVTQKHRKQIEALLYENKTLKTNMYWLATELKTVKNKEGQSPRRTRHDSGGLEEGNAGHRAVASDGNNDICSCVKNIVAYTRKLERTISTLKTALSKNNVIINNLLLKKFGHVPKIMKENDSLGSCKLSESYITITADDMLGSESNLQPTDHVVWEARHEETYKLPELESASVIVPLDEASSDDDTSLNYGVNRDLCTQSSTVLHLDASGEVDTGKNAILYPDIRRRSLEYLQHPSTGTRGVSDDDDPGDEHDHDSLNDSYSNSALKKLNCPCNLPLSLIHNLELQQTKTYLTSKTSNDCKNIHHDDERKAISPIGSPCHTESRNLLELFDKKTSRKVNNLEIT